MTLEEIHITDFKNIATASLHLAPKLNCILGDNGMGKSNLLDGVHYLSLGKSFTGLTDGALVRRTAPLMMLSGVYRRHGDKDEVMASFQPGRRKSLKRNGKEYQRISEHVGQFPVVMVAPSDLDIVTGAGIERRRYLDMLISQGSASYLQALIRYQRLLQQRNALLRTGASDPALYLSIEQPMASAANEIVRQRLEYIRQLRTLVSRYYAEVAADDTEDIDMQYQASVPGLENGPQALIEALDNARNRDVALGHTSVGPHRDDLVLTMRQMAMQRTASQGQAKTMATVLRLAQYELLTQATGMKPLLLLDDVFDKLDAGRVERIIGLVAGDTFGQIFITDTQRHHLEAIIARTPGEHAVFTAFKGQFTQQSL